MAEDQDIIRARQARELAKRLAEQRAAEDNPVIDPYYVRDPKTGLSPAQVEANQAVAEAAKASGRQIVPGDTGESNRVLTPYEMGSKEYLGKTYATAAGAYSAAVNAADKAGPPGPAPAGLHWNLQGTEWKLYDAEGKPFNYIGTGTEDFSGDGTAGSPLLYKGKPFNGTRGGVTYVNGIPKGAGSGKVETRRVTNPDGSVTIFYNDGTSTTIPKSSSGGGGGGDSTGSTTKTYTAPDGKIFTDLGAYNAYIAQTAADAKRKAGQSAYDILLGEFDRYGMGGLLNDVKEFIVQGLSRDELLLKLRATDAYNKRFAANAQRVKKGLRALSEAEYVALEDQYQNVMRNYGLPASYYTKGDMGVQPGFEKFIAGDVSAAELEDRIQTAQNRVINAAPEVGAALRQFYPDITNGDILAYTLDPEQALSTIKRKVGAAEIGAGALQAGLATGLSRAEELQKYGVTGEQARQGYQSIAEFLPSATKLGDIYRKSGMGPYNQTVAEQEVFGVTGAADAAAKRKKLAQLESAQFSGTTGIAQGALSRERAGQF
jgi:hypothetical protein